MSQLIRYCKAYPIESFRQFDGWSRTISSSAEVLFLHDTYVVTEDVFDDQGVVFRDVTEAWKQFCKTVLRFEPEQYIGNLEPTVT